MNYTDSNTPAAVTEALAAISSGLTPKRVEDAIRGHRRTIVAQKYGFDPGAIRRLGLRWGLLRREGGE